MLTCRVPNPLSISILTSYVTQKGKTSLLLLAQYIDAIHAKLTMATMCKDRHVAYTSMASIWYFHFSFLRSVNSSGNEIQNACLLQRGSRVSRGNFGRREISWNSNFNCHRCRRVRQSTRILQWRLDLVAPDDPSGLTNQYWPAGPSILSRVKWCGKLFRLFSTIWGCLK